MPYFATTVAEQNPPSFEFSAFAKKTMYHVRKRLLIARFRKATHKKSRIICQYCIRMKTPQKVHIRDNFQIPTRKCRADSCHDNRLICEKKLRRPGSENGNRNLPNTIREAYPEKDIDIPTSENVSRAALDVGNLHVVFFRCDAFTSGPTKIIRYAMN